MRPAHLLRDNKRNAVPSRLIIYDTESYQERIDESTTKHTLRLGWMNTVFVKYVKGKPRFYENYTEFKTVKEFWDRIEDFIPEKTKAYLIAHNQHFDFIILNGFNELKARGWELKRWAIDSSLFIATFRKENKTIVVMDSLNIFKNSIRELGESVGLEKLKVDFDTVSDKELSVYCKRDTEILSEVFKRWIRFLQDHDLGNFRYTISGQAFSAFRHRFKDYEIYIHNNEDVLKLEREAYRGGRTECFFIGEVSEPVYVLDVNSIYSYVMKAFEYPTFLVKHGAHLSPKGLERFLQDHCVIARCELEVDKPVFGVRKDRLIFPVGKYQATLCTQELKYALEHNYIKTINEYAIYLKAPVFGSYVNFFNDLKEKYSKEGDKVNRLLTKYFLNTLYGKFGQKNEKIKEIGEVDTNTALVSTYVNKRTGEIGTLYEINGKQYIRTKEYEEAYDSFPAIAAEISANARMYLWSLITKAGRENVYYCDTDSLFTNAQGLERLKDYINPYELGKLKVERENAHLIIRNVKDYILDNEQKIKGVRKDSVRLGEHRYKTYRFLKFRTLLRKGNLNAPIVESYIKELKEDYKKGVVLENGKVEPYVLS